MARSLSVKHLDSIASSETQLVCLGADEKRKYVDNKITDTIDHVALKALDSELGEVQLVFSPVPGLAEELNQRINFGQLFTLSDIGTVTDIKIGMYNNSLTIKFFMIKEEL